jgi:hypothetical protein
MITDRDRPDGEHGVVTGRVSGSFACYASGLVRDVPARWCIRRGCWALCVGTWSADVSGGFLTCVHLAGQTACGLAPGAGRAGLLGEGFSMAIPRGDRASLGGPPGGAVTGPVAQNNQDGRLEAFAGGNGALCNRWQERWRDGPDHVVWRHQGWNAKPRPRPEVGLAWLEWA